MIQFIKDTGEQIHLLALKLTITSIIMIVVMWFFNITGFRELNLVVFILGSIWLAWKLANPKLITSAGGLGFLISALWDSDKSQGVPKGVLAYFRVGLWVVFGFMMLALPLATWDFSPSPASFFLLMAGVMLTMVAAQLLELKGRTVGWIGLAYGTLVILGAVWMSTGISVNPTLLDLSTTAPGEKLGAYIGPEMVNWVMWPILGVLTYQVAARTFRVTTPEDPGVAKPKSQAKTETKNGNILWVLAWVVMIGGGYYGATEWYRESSVPKTEHKAYTGVDLRGEPDFAKRSVTIPIDGGVNVILPARRRGEEARLCLEVLEGTDIPRPVMDWTISSLNGVIHQAVVNDKATSWLRSHGHKDVTVTFVLRPTEQGC